MREDDNTLSELPFKWVTLVMLIWCWATVIYLKWFDEKNFFDSVTALFLSVIPVAVATIAFVYLLLTNRGSHDKTMGPGDYAHLSENQRWGVAAIFLLGFFSVENKVISAWFLVIVYILVLGTLWRDRIIGKEAYGSLCVLLFVVEGTMMFFK
ncbi:hypothetical protein [Levilactobacillus tujiorum]|uniref:Tripartite tricarboxylate transporter TctB family protein n=1 Tax=Levilactobacillus tujiorum TaxID=2912243 RepID=A0ABX1L534_9LACO|nr:hypothetical protein [Levilactobacillus tujiorum]MCH5465122.1 hypothetical protein [Levilactobacillus tujiorum]NLR12402.1 hypothetical protein [Lactobacillus sp. HBUAS51387]NLR30145.1 hypothetical protein [Levilactobacillus tujiorum]